MNLAKFQDEEGFLWLQENPLLVLSLPDRVAEDWQVLTRISSDTKQTLVQTVRDGRMIKEQYELVTAVGFAHLPIDIIQDTDFELYFLFFEDNQVFLNDCDKNIINLIFDIMSDYPILPLPDDPRNIFLVNTKKIKRIENNSFSSQNNLFIDSSHPLCYRISLKRAMDFLTT